jgi:hypothetical protein
LKPSFNKSGQNWTTAPQKALGAAPAASEKSRRVMATITSASLPASGETRDRQSGLFAGIRAYWRQFLVRAFDPYRPELHYMRGPGPAWRAKHLASPHLRSR